MQKMAGIALWPNDNLPKEDSVDWRVFTRETPEPVLVTDSATPESIGSRRRIIYTNRRRTLRRLYCEGDLVETGIEEVVRRIRIRAPFQEPGQGNIFGMCIRGTSFRYSRPDDTGDSPLGVRVESLHRR